MFSSHAILRGYDDKNFGWAISNELFILYHYLFLGHAKVPQQRFRVIQTQPSQIGISSGDCPLGLLLIVGLLGGLVGHPHVGEALAAAGGIGWTSELEQTFAAHRLDVGASRVPWGDFHLCYGKF